MKLWMSLLRDRDASSAFPVKHIPMIHFVSCVRGALKQNNTSVRMTSYKTCCCGVCDLLVVGGALCVGVDVRQLDVRVVL